MFGPLLWLTKPKSLPNICTGRVLFVPPQGSITVLFCIRSTTFFGTLDSFRGSYLLEQVYRGRWCGPRCLLKAHNARTIAKFPLSSLRLFISRKIEQTISPT